MVTTYRDPRQQFGPGENVVPGAQQGDLDAINSLTPDRIAAGTTALEAELQAGVLGQTQAAGELNFQQALGMRQIDSTERSARQSIISDALSRGIYRSGIREQGEQEVTEQAYEARALLERDTTLGLLNIQNMIQQLNNQFGLGLADFASMTVGGLEDFYSQQIGAYGVQGGYSGGIANGAGSGNRVWQNRTDAINGIGPYGLRAQTVQSYASQWSATYGLQANAGMRDWNVKPEGGATNSDHYTGGAIDISVNPNDPSAVAKGEALLGELARLKAAGVVSGWIWHPDRQGDAHYDHIHVSFALPGGGQNTNSISVSGIGTTTPPVTTSTTRTNTDSGRIGGT